MLPTKHGTVMLLYLMRHGVADDASPTGRDADRALSREGTLRTAMVAKGFARLVPAFDRLITSPYARARGTAEIVARICGHAAEPLHDERMVPHARFDAFSDMLHEHDDAETLVVVGHEPSMSGFISGLCAGGALEIDVRKASVTAIHVTRFRPHAAGTLLWSLSPKVFEALSR